MTRQNEILMVQDEEKLLRELDMLKQEHESLDDVINHSLMNPLGMDQISLQRLKKRKLWLKDKIAEIEAIVYPDIIA